MGQERIPPCTGNNKELYSSVRSVRGSKILTDPESQNVLAPTRLCFATIAKVNSPQQMILGDLRVWVLISYNRAASKPARRSGRYAPRRKPMIPNRKPVIEMTIGLLVMAGTVQAASTFINTCPFVITSPGDYLLAADLVCGGGGGITIKSSNVTLKLAGHRITAGRGADNAIVTPGAGRLQNINILGPGLITNGGGGTFSAGIFLVVVDNSEVRGITVLGLNAGIEAADCINLTITANTLARNSFAGIVVYNGFSYTISENDASGNGTGISVEDTAATVTHNVLNGNTFAGLSIPLVLAFTGITVQNNVINGNGQYGIFVGVPVTGVEVTHNRSLANGMFDLFSKTPDCHGDVWSGDTFFTANETCIH